jgi:dinuclear metal center YbgI/SA1388 family protein
MVPAIKLQDILAYLGRLAPWELAEPWDNVGLMTGSPDQEVTGVLVALDPTLQVLDEAIRRKTNTILTHHPLIFHPLKSINTASPIGQFLQRALAHDIAVVSCHTNLDIIDNGVSDALAAALGLRDTRPLRQTGPQPGLGFGRVGKLPAPMPAAAFFPYAAERLQLQGMLIAGTPPDIVDTVAVCGGSGSDLAEAARQAGAGVYLTAEVKHAVARWAEESGLCIVDGGHFATENIIIPHLIDLLTDFFHRHDQTTPVVAAQKQANPLRYYIANNSTP